jgi:hypothetical protein
VSLPRSPTTTPKEDAVIVADVSFADIFWSLLWFYFLFLWIMVLFHILGDLFRDHPSVSAFGEADQAAESLS